MMNIQKQDACYKCGKAFDEKGEFEDKMSPSFVTIVGTYDIGYYCFGCSIDEKNTR